MYTCFLCYNDFNTDKKDITLINKDPPESGGDNYFTFFK